MSRHTSASISTAADTSRGTIRTFVALPLPESIKRALHNESEQLRSSPVLHFRKWVHPSDYHITLQFLDETEREQIDPLCDALAKELKEIGRLRPFMLELAGWGWFGKKQRPSILWKGISDPEGMLPQLAALTKRVTEQFGFQDDGKPFSPHITVARQYTGEQFPADQLLLPEGSQKTPSQVSSWEAQSIVLYESRLNEKPMYAALRHISFAD